MMPITQEEANKIVAHVSPIFQQVVDEYDFSKYPAEELARFKALFSTFNPTNNDIKDAMIWKWGHWGKPNFPKHHKKLIDEIQTLWPQFVVSGCTIKPEDTFCWWLNKLGRKTTYISVAYITHLVHHKELSIIDQHNYRAMNSLITWLRPNLMHKKKPSNWNDIISLNKFMSLIHAKLEGYTLSDIDRFLMMYGRNHAVRQQKCFGN